MANLNVKSKTKDRMDRKPRVYFTCHPADFEPYFETICEDLFRTHDCAVSYTPDMTEPIPEEEREVDLGRNNLFVVPVTFKLLTEKNRAMDEDLPYAMAHHIPILPLLMEEGVDAYYKAKFGELQYLRPNTGDLTEIAYGEKLRKYLETVLISDETASRIRAAFDAYIFLSYRKKDRHFANTLMRHIHKDPALQDIAIWFDEFLTPGESFRQGIEEALEKAELFALLVTPRILEQSVDKASGKLRDNFVLSTEIPMAKEKRSRSGMEILPVEMEETDKASLDALELPPLTHPEDEDFYPRLMSVLEKIADGTNNTPEHNFLIGLAYLDGIDVEVDRERAITLITAAAEAGHPDAMERLYHLYGEGKSTLLNYEKALYWAEKLYEHTEKTEGKSAPATVACLHNLAVAYRENGDPRKALPLAEEAYDRSAELYGEEDSRTTVSLHGLAMTYGALGDYREEFACYEEIAAIRAKNLGYGHPATMDAYGDLARASASLGNYELAEKLMTNLYSYFAESRGEEHVDTLAALYTLATIQSDLGKNEEVAEKLQKLFPLSCKVLGERHPRTLGVLNSLAVNLTQSLRFHEALPLLEMLYAARCEVVGEEHPVTLHTLNNLALTYSGLGDLEKAVELQKKVYETRLKKQGEDHPDTLSAMVNLAALDSERGEKAKAAELLEEIYPRSCRILGEDHPDTVAALHNLGSVYTDMGDLDKALPLIEKAHFLHCKRLGAEHPSSQKSMSALERVFKQKGGNRAMASCLERICKALEQKENGNFAAAASLRKELLKRLAALGDGEWELRCRKELYQSCAAGLGEGHPDTVAAAVALTDALSAYGRWDEELIYAEKAYRASRRENGADHPATQKARARVMETYENSGEYEKALLLEEEELKKLTEEAPCLFDTSNPVNDLLQRINTEEKPEDPNATRILTLLKSMIRHARELQNAEKEAELADRAYTLCLSRFAGHKALLAESTEDLYLAQSKALGEIDPRTLETLEKLALLVHKLGDKDKEKRCAEKAFTAAQRLVLEEKEALLPTLQNALYLYKWLGSRKELARLSSLACKRLKKRLGKSHPDTLALKELNSTLSGLL